MSVSFYGKRSSKKALTVSRTPVLRGVIVPVLRHRGKWKTATMWYVGKELDALR